MTLRLLLGTRAQGRASTLLVLAVLYAGCTLSNLTPTARFSESVYNLNDMARWGQVDMAAHNVSPKYQAEFRTRRRDWGEGIAVAEVELLGQVLAPDKESGVSEIALSWTEANGVMLRKSFITQRWANEHGSFRLVAEVVKKGDPNVFAASEPPAQAGP